MAAVFSVIAVIQYALHAGAMEGRYGVKLITVVATYTFGGAIGGLLVGLLLPISKSKIGAGALGVIALLPLVVMIQHMTIGPAQWGTDNTAVVVIGSLMLGVPLGLMEREQASRADRKRGK